MAKLTGQLIVGIMRFNEGVDLETVQGSIDRLWQRCNQAADEAREWHDRWAAEYRDHQATIAHANKDAADNSE